MESNDISCQPSVEVKQYNRKQLPGDGAAGSPSWSSSSSPPSCFVAASSSPTGTYSFIINIIIVIFLQLSSSFSFLS